MVTDEQIDASVIQNICDFVRLEEAVDWNNDAASAQNAEKGRNELRAILEPEPHPITWPHCRFGLKVFSQGTSLRKYLAIRHLLLSKEDGRFCSDLNSNRAERSRQVHTPSLNVIPLAVKSNRAAENGIPKPSGAMSSQIRGVKTLGHKCAICFFASA